MAKSGKKSTRKAVYKPAPLAKPVLIQPAPPIRYDDEDPYEIIDPVKMKHGRPKSKAKRVLHAKPSLLKKPPPKAPKRFSGSGIYEATVRRERSAAPDSGSQDKTTKIPYHRKPQELSLEAWQVGLRKQFAETREFGIEKLGREPVFTDYRVTNHENHNSYKVSLRDNMHSMNFCECMDFKTNLLGTCKHIEAVIRMAESRFKKFMATVGELVSHEPGVGSREPEFVSRETEPEPQSPSYLEPQSPSSPVTRLPSDSDPQIPGILTKGLEFLTALGTTLSQPGGAAKLAESITSTDPADGKTYLKIPVASKQVIEQAICALAVLFGNANRVVTKE